MWILIQNNASMKYFCKNIDWNTDMDDIWNYEVLRNINIELNGLYAVKGREMKYFEGINCYN